MNLPDFLNPRTLRGRLTLAYAGALIAALVTFAVIALAVVDAAQRRGLDAQLETTASALTFVGDIDDGNVIVDGKDREQFGGIVGPRADGAILSPDGTVVVSSDNNTARALAAFATSTTKPAFATIPAGGDRLRAYSQPKIWHDRVVGHILTWHDAESIAELDRSLGLAFLFAIPIVAMVAVLAGAEIARRGLEPVQRIATLAGEIEARDLSRRLSLGERGDELGRLGSTFNRMLDRLQSAFDRERQFTSDASHELRAPLSVIRAEADLALRRERSPEQYRAALTIIASEADALEELTRDLLAAARDGSDSTDIASPIDLAQTVTSAQQRMAVLAAVRNIRVEPELHSRVSINANRSMLERAIIAVVHNSIKYTPDGGNVRLIVERQNGAAQLLVVDEGPGFSSEALKHGLERLWRDIDARAHDGSGLGLSLARSIVERYGGTIELANADPHGAIVRMTFPANPPGPREEPSAENA